MADVKIANLTAKTTWADTDLIIVEDGTDTKKMTVATLKSLLSNITGGQLKFPATQIPSTDVNTLDDYEEGTFTPEILFDGNNIGMTYSYREGHWTKIGNVVRFNLIIGLSNKGTSQGQATIAGLPFNHKSGFNYGSYPITPNAITSVGYICSQSLESTNKVELYQYASATGVKSIITHANFSNASEVIMSGHYEA